MMKTATIARPGRLRSLILFFRTITTMNPSPIGKTSLKVKQQTDAGNKYPLYKAYTGHYFAGPHGIFDPRLFQ